MGGEGGGVRVNRWPIDDPRNSVFAQCESAIEQALCFEMFERLQLQPDPLGRQISPGAAFLSAQQEIGPYRVDFLIVALDPARRAPLRLAIECDGAEYHTADVDKERDAERDRWMRARGFVVSRFTGSEIWTNTDKVIAAIAKVIKTAVPCLLTPSAVPLRYLARDCAAMLPLLLRRGGALIPLLSLQRSITGKLSEAAKRWLGTERALLPPSHPALLIDARPPVNAVVTKEEEEIELRARSNYLLRGVLPEVLDHRWLDYLKWREEDRDQRVRAVKALAGKAPERGAEFLQPKEIV